MIENKIKSSLSSDELLEAVDLALWAGRLLLQFGAETEKVEHAVQNIGRSLGCDNLSSIITHNSIILTITSGKEFRTKIIKVIRQGVNFDVLSKVGRLSHIAREKELKSEEVREILKKIELKPRNYGEFITHIFVAFACASFSMLFGGDFTIFILTSIAAFIGSVVKSILIKHQFNTLLVPLLSAFVATIIAGISPFFSHHPEIVFASSVLFLIPGVQLINATEDLIKGHFVVGFTRGFIGILISLSIAFGITFGLLLVRSLV